MSVELQDRAAEEAVIGSLLIDSEFGDGTAAFKIRDILSPEDFFHEHLGRAYRAALDLTASKTPVDMLTISRAMRSTINDPDSAHLALKRIVDSVPTSLHIEHYGRIVREFSRRRLLLTVAGGIAKLAHDEMSPDDAISRGLAMLLELRENRAGGARLLRDLTAGMAADIEHVLGHPGPDSGGVPTPWRKWTEATMGFQPGQLYLLAARPSRGKTKVAGHCLLTAAEFGGLPVMFSLEMGRRQLLWRFAAAMAGVDLFGHRSGRKPMTTDEQDRVRYQFGRLAELWAAVDDRSGLQVADIRAECLRLQAEHGAISLVVVDYTGLLHSEAENETAKARRVTGDLKILARDLDVPVLALAQLNRQSEGGGSSRPKTLKELFQGGEADADQVWYVHSRDVDYRMGLTPVREHVDEFSDSQPGVLELGSLKHRDGQIGLRVYLHDDAATGRISEWAPAHYESEVDRKWQAAGGDR